MIAYTLKRILAAIPTLLIIITLAFFLMHAAPGGPFAAERPVPPAVQQNLNRMYHLDQPVIVQYGDYLADILRGDFGPSFKYADYSVNDLIAAGFPVSLQLGVSAILLALILGIAAGAYAALRRDSWVDHLLRVVTMTGISVPNFVVAPLLILVFAVTLHWLPAGGWNRGAFADAVLPTIALALPYIAYIARLTRTGMLEALASDYVRTARSKGLPARTIVLRHALKPALLPVVSFLGPAIAGIITGSVIVEEIFGIPGLGRFFVQGALNRDYTLVMGVVIFYAMLIIALNLAADLLYGWLDPKVRYGARA